MKKYNLLYMKRVAVFVSVISLLLTLLLLVAALIYKKLTVACLCPLVVGTVVWGLSLYRIPFAARLVYEQEKALGVEFDGIGAMPLYPKSGVFLSNTWLIASGRLYLHRDFIQGVSIRTRPWKGRKDYYCLFKCRDGDHRLFVDSSVSAKKIKTWFDAGKT